MSGIRRRAMQTVRTMIAGRRFVTGRVLRAGLVIASALLVFGCNTDREITGAPATPSDYRLRHPITIKEAAHTFELFIGSNRGSLTPTQRAEVLAFAQSWRRQATGGVIVELPAGSSNARAAADALPEIRSLLAASGVPANSIFVRRYHSPRYKLATVRISYPRITAQAGPCGLWPDDLGPTIKSHYGENQEYWNFGCATQRNLAAMVANPADLVEPRGETPAYTMRRTSIMEQYRAKGNAVITEPSPLVTINMNK
jgi:pilus assembly protein CpaD